MIEKNLHFIWDKGYDAMPKDYKYNVQSWTRHHPGWNIYFWDKTKMDRLVQNHYPEFLNLWKSCVHIMENIDIIKFIILHHHGGVYVDTDILCMKPYPEDFLRGQFVVSKLRTDDLCNNEICLPVIVSSLFKWANPKLMLNSGFYAGKKGSPILHNLVKEIEKSKKNITRKLGQEIFIAWTGGPMFLTERSIKENWDDNTDVIVLDNGYIEPCGIEYGITKDIDTCDVTEQTIGVHMHQLSWATPTMKRFMRVWYHRKIWARIISLFLAIFLAYLYSKHRWSAGTIVVAIMFFIVLIGSFP